MDRGLHDRERKNIYVMLLTHDKFKSFTPKAIWELVYMEPSAIKQ